MYLPTLQTVTWTERQGKLYSVTCLLYEFCLLLASNFFICFQKSDGANIKNFKTTKQKSCIKDTFRQFVSDNDAVMNTYLRRLKSIQATQEVSPFFKSHEVNKLGLIARKPFFGVSEYVIFK